MRGIQVVPAHFVHAYRKHGLHFWIDSLLYQAGEKQFIGKKSSGMAKVKNEGMSQRYRFLEIGLVVLQDLEKLLVAIKSGMEIAPYFLAFCLDIVSGKTRVLENRGLGKFINFESSEIGSTGIMTFRASFKFIFNLK